MLNKFSKMIFKGSTTLSLQDFKLTTPKKIMGLIQIKDAIVIYISLESIVNKKTP